jgi:N-acetylmuramoyl-L-alanine amidase
MAFDRTFGTATVYCEASDQAQDCQLGVAYSELNRLRTGRFGSTMAEICLKRKQYSEWNGDPVNNANLLRVAAISDSDPVLLQCAAMYDAAESGGLADPTDGATHYYDTSIAPPTWTVGATKTVQLGRLVFWKNVK